ncbi:MAG: heme lyase CcmF/NrfE family subunit [Gammaproteobacteria bacterium]|jgi:cytochrome c-type biogenesis protein CcmF|nr:heme lyase CcmF/NrfE family subunit [Gammaproteobacteria bacterium]
MIPEIGHFALIMALLMAALLGTLPLVGAARGNFAWMRVARPAAQAQFAFVLIAYLCLSYAFWSHDFSVSYVANHSNSALPWYYRLAAVWGGHEGSLLLWMLMLAGWTCAVSVLSRRLPEEMVARVLGVMGLVAVGFLLFVLDTSNPFERLLPAAPDGQDLNPLLQDPGLIFHPPLLYMGYVGFSVAFAFAIAALLGGRLDAAWARWSRPWTTTAWIFLTLGIALGSWWAYYELGWGGWWFWDPVENASFMPWLVGTALIHSLAVTEKRGVFRSWTVLLAILAFSLSLLGTFLVRSGVLTSVHAFATDPERGTFILALLAVVVGSSLVLFAWRASGVRAEGKFSMLSRESLLLSNNVLLVVAMGTVLLGTLYPLVLDALGLGKISVGPPYFDAVFVPLMAPMVFLMGLAPIARWKKAELPELAVRLRWAFATSVAVALFLPLVLGKWTPMIALGMLLAAWIFTTIFFSIARRVRRAREMGTAPFAGASRSYWGMQTAHLGVGVFIVGVTMVNGFEVERDLRMEIGDVTELAGYEFRFDGVSQQNGPNYQAARGRIEVMRNGDTVAIMHPEKRVYLVQTMPMTEAAIDTNLFRDLYVSLGEPVANGAWSIRIYYKPFVVWIWGGCVLMAIGGLLAISDRRYRLAIRRQRTVAADTAAGSPAAGLATEGRT